MAPNSTNPFTGQPAGVSALAGIAAGQEERVVVEWREMGKREKLLHAEEVMSLGQACAADPHIHLFADFIDQLNERPHKLGGRPLAHPTWEVVLFGELIGVFGSASNVERVIAKPNNWQTIAQAALPHLPPGVVLSETGPRQWIWAYYLNQRFVPQREQIRGFFEELAARRAREVGLLDPDTMSLSHPGPNHLVVGDGKIMDSPQARDNTRTRKDPARTLHREGGHDGWVQGTHFVIPSTRGHLPGLRVALSLDVVEPDSGGEAAVFERTFLRIAEHSPGIAAFITDGALRGTHRAKLMQQTGCHVVTPVRKADVANGGVRVGRHTHRAAPLPMTTDRQAKFAKVTGCRGHSLHTLNGTVHEEVITANATRNFTEIRRGPLKRQRNKKSGLYSFYVEFRMPCRHTNGQHTHIWRESFTPTTHDTETQFNRCEALHTIHPTHPDYARIYGRRADSESFNAQLERTFHKNRLPAWGIDRQFAVMLHTLLARNAWALHCWQRERDRHTRPPPKQAA